MDADSGSKAILTSGHLIRPQQTLPDLILFLQTYKQHWSLKTSIWF